MTKTSGASRSLRGSTALLLGRLFSMAPAVVVQVLLARYYSAEDFGGFGLALALAALAGTVLPLGTSRALPRSLADHEATNDRAAILGNLTFVVGLTGVLGVLGWLVLRISTALGATLVDPQLTTLVLIIYAIGLLEALDRIGETTCAVFGIVRAILVRKYGLGPMLRLTAVLLAVWLDWTIVELAVAYIVAALAGTLLYAAIVVRALQLGKDDSWTEVSRHLNGVKQVRRGLPMLAHGLMHTWIASGGIVLLGVLNGAAAAATFKAAMPLAIFLQGLGATFGITYLPLVARLAQSGDRHTLSQAYWRYSAWLLALLFPASAMLIGFPEQVLQLLYGSRFSNAAPALRLVVLGYFLYSALGLHGQTLQMLNRYSALLRLDLVIAPAFTISTLVLASTYGATGAAWAVFGALTALAALSMRLLVGTSIDRPARQVFVAQGVAVACLLAAVLVDFVFAPPLVLALVLNAVLALVVGWYALPAMEVSSVVPGLSHRIFRTREVSNQP